MDYSGLSSNWKKLQQSLDAQKTHNGADSGSTLPAKPKSSSSRHRPKRAPAIGEKRKQTTDSKRHAAGARSSSSVRRSSSSSSSSSSKNGASASVKRRRIDETASLQRPSRSSRSHDGSRKTGGVTRADDSQPALQQRNASLQLSEGSAAPPPPKKIGKYVGLDCEMVGIGSSSSSSSGSGDREQQQQEATSGKVRTFLVPPQAVALQRRGPQTQRNETHSLLARVSMVSYTGEAIYDAYVAPPRSARIVNYRTEFSGIRAWHLSSRNPNRPRPLERVQREVTAILRGRIVVGHALDGDLEALNLKGVVPRARMRDTSLYPRYRSLLAEFDKKDPGHEDALLASSSSSSSSSANNGRAAAASHTARTPALRRLARKILGWDIQSDWAKGHSSVEDARAAMELFKIQKQGFETEARRLYGAAAAAAAPTSLPESSPTNPSITNNGSDHGNNNDEDEDDGD